MAEAGRLDKTGRAAVCFASADYGDLSQYSPAMRQYLEFKRQYPDSILFFQMGDFYELFFDDAVEVAPLLDIALTSRSRKGDKPIPMCGVPLRAGVSYANRLTALGYSVRLCVQLGDASAKGLVQRSIWQMGTPGLPLEDEAETASELYWLAAIYPANTGLGLACLAAATGELILGRFEDLDSLRAEFMALSPRECLVPPELPPALGELLKQVRVYATVRPPEALDGEAALEQFNQLFGPRAVEAWELDQCPEVLAAAGAVLDYARGCYGGQLAHLSEPKLLWSRPHLILDEAALSNLEILKSLRQGELAGSLLGLMDRTVTAMGGRLIRQYLARPLAEAAPIKARHGAVEELLRHGLDRHRLRALLKRTGDLERALSRTVLGRGGPRDLASVRDALALLPEYRALLADFNSIRLAELGESLPDLSALADNLARALVDSPPVSVKDGGLIRRGFLAELDELMDLEKGGKSAIAALEARERERTGISSLKVGFNRVYGYYLEVTKANLSLIPPQWIRKQTVANGERFLTEELKQWEEKILHAGEKRLELEARLFEELKRQLGAQVQAVRRAANVLAELDVLAALAEGAEKFGWVRPELTQEDIIMIKGGRHPVVEAMLPPGEVFVANDIRLDRDERLMVITGPNMAGKSTILRQVALILIMCQVGSFVPADSARLSIRDRIFTRVGASDDLARGRSTFMVEMSETARILARATTRSLVVLDEVGRGTSTYDGLSLAWAIAEYLHDLDGRGVPTLFATHYHELIELARSKARVRNYNVSVKNVGGRVTFMRELKPGGVNRSYGLAVAAMAGLPKAVVERARDIMADLTKGPLASVRPALRQLSLFEALEEPPEPVMASEDPRLRQVAEKLAQVDAEALTPLQALSLLNSLSEEARLVLDGVGEGP